MQCYSFNLFHLRQDKKFALFMLATFLCVNLSIRYTFNTHLFCKQLYTKMPKMWSINFHYVNGPNIIYDYPIYVHSPLNLTITAHIS